MIEFKNVTKDYGKTVHALKNIDLAIERGEFVTLVGPSGAGKSTIIRLLTREELPTSGEIIVAGRDIVKLRSKELPYYRRKVGVIFQDFKLLRQKTVAENVAYALEVSDAPPDEISRKVPLILDLVGLSHRMKNYPNELSGGERQRVSIARALIHTPKILIADEPTGNLDPVNTWEIIELLFKINKRGTIVILATHDREVVNALQKRVVTLKDGVIISDQEKGKYIL